MPRLASRNSELDTQATVKFLGALLMSLLWWARPHGRRVAVGRLGVGRRGAGGRAAPGPLHLYFLERWAIIWRDISVFFTLGSRARLKALLLQDGERLAAEVDTLAGEYRPRIDQALPSESRS